MKNILMKGEGKIEEIHYNNNCFNYGVSLSYSIL